MPAQQQSAAPAVPPQIKPRADGAPHPRMYQQGADRHLGKAARGRGFSDSSRLKPHLSRMPAQPIHAFGSTKVLDVDWALMHRGEKDWVERDRHRTMQRFAKFQGLSTDGSGPKPHPWTALKDGQVSPGAVGSMAPPRSGGASARLPDARGPVVVNAPPSTASSRSLSTASGPPRTSSTTLSCLWRRALSTPALRDGETRDGLPLGLSLQEYVTRDLSDGLDQEEIGRLIEHVHSKILQERRRRKDAQADLAAVKAEKSLRKQAIAARQPTPAVR